MANRRNLVAWVGIGALLFLQLATSTYACTMASFAMTQASVEMSDAPAPCHGDGAPASKLCEQHCQQDANSVDTQPHDAPMAPVLPLLAVVAPVDPYLPIARAQPAVPVDPPPLVRFGTLRI